MICKNYITYKFSTVVALNRFVFSVKFVSIDIIQNDRDRMFVVLLAPVSLNDRLEVLANDCEKNQF